MPKERMAPRAGGLVFSRRDSCAICNREFVYSVFISLRESGVAHVSCARVGTVAHYSFMHERECGGPGIHTTAYESRLDSSIL
jgi:hypothetical protein